MECGEGNEETIQRGPQRLKENEKKSGHRKQTQRNIKDDNYFSFGDWFNLSPGKVFTAVTKKIVMNVAGQEPWPDNVKLYQPYETEQILLPDNANCLAVQAFLKMCNLKFTIEYKANAEYMSPSGKVPFIKCGPFLVSELDPITSFVANKGISLTSDLDGTQKSDMRAYMSLVNTVLGNAENYITWVDPLTYSQVTKPRYGSVHPFPLNHILTYLKRQSVIRKLSALGWYSKTIDVVYDEVDQCCQALSERLEKQPYFFGDSPCQVDAVLFGHVYAILTTRSFPVGLRLASIVRSYVNIVEHCLRIMPMLNLNGDILEEKPHPKWKCKDKKITEEPSKLNVLVDEEYLIMEDNTVNNNYNQDICSIANPQNLIYSSVFK